jgi:hypothetical protein
MLSLPLGMQMHQRHADNPWTINIPDHVARANSAGCRASMAPTASQAGYSRNPRQDVCTGRHAAWPRPASARRGGLAPAIPKPSCGHG